MTSIVPSASLSLYLHPFLPALSLCSSLPPSLSNCPPLSGDLAEAKCFLLSRCRWDCNKACQWEAWVALSHALCLPSVNSLQPTTTLPIPVPSNPSARRSLPKTLCFYSPPTHTHTHTHTHHRLICLPFLPSFRLAFTRNPCSLTCLSCLSISLVSLPTALSGNTMKKSSNRRHPLST